RARAPPCLLTPLPSAIGTGLGSELAALAMRVFGGMGYIEETGGAQYYRDVRIAAIYEGTNGIQAMDFVGRKMPVRMGQSFMEFIAEMKDVLPELEADGEDFASIQKNLEKGIEGLEKVTGGILQTGQADPNSVIEGATP